jgi:PKHD-type hydroxylase
MFNNFDLLEERTNIAITEVQIIPGFLKNHEITAIQEFSKELPLQQGGIKGNNANNNLILRESQIKWLEWNDENWWLYTKIMEKVKATNQTTWKFDLYGINEYIQYTEYADNPNARGHYDWHIDVSHVGISSNRKISFECVLEDNYTGGETSLLLGPTENKVRLKKGDAIIYPSYLLNKVYPVISGKRSSIVSWISGPAFK